MQVFRLSWLGGAALSLCAGLAAAGGNGSATLTVDNEFWLYSGNATGSNLQFVGHGSDWTRPYSFSFDVAPGDYLYLMAIDWDDLHAWQGLFDTPLGRLYSNAASWVAAPTSTTEVTAGLIIDAGWDYILTELPASSSPWGDVVGNADAKWIWNSAPTSSDLTVLFRSANPVAAVPEPESYALMIGGLGVLGFMGRRKT